jgi:hypothetical protein
MREQQKLLAKARGEKIKHSVVERAKDLLDGLIRSRRVWLFKRLIKSF